ncbi:MAG TPA: PEP-CTERM sorting domain-containing protein [Burkholderiales bacterium]|nr:PEP-CTERM sorting domain-containing protein [Burkholderiales bacterium]
MLIDNPGSFSTLTVNGNVTLGGALNIVINPGFSFALGQTYNILSFTPGNLTGEFASITDGALAGSGNILDIGNGLALDLLYGADNVLLQVAAFSAPGNAVPEPPQSAIILTGLATMFLALRRRNAAGRCRDCPSRLR